MKQVESATWKQSITGFAFILPGFIMFLVFMCIPSIQSFFLSFTEWSGIGPKQYVGLNNYIEMFSKDPIYWVSLKNNLLWAVGAATVPIWLGLFLANLLVRGHLRHTKGFQVIYFMPQVISMVAAAIMWKWIYDPFYGPLNRIFAILGMEGLSQTGWLGDPNMVVPSLFVIYVWKSFGFSTVVFIAALQGVDHQLYDASKIDGCGSWGQFWNVTMPGIRQAMTSVTLLMVVWSFNMFDLVRTTTSGGPGISSMVISYYIYHHGFITGRTGYATAVSVVLAIMVLIFSRTFMYFREKE